MKGKRSILMAIAIVAVVVSGISLQVWSDNNKESSGMVTELILPKAHMMLPVTNDFRNYFVFQSLGSVSSIIIGDFSGADKVITLITDSNIDGKADVVSEYFPDIKKMRNPSKPSTGFYSDFSTVRDEIIGGKIFTANYSYNMQSIDSLKARIRTGKDISQWKYGYNVKIFDPDNPSTIMSQFFFSRKDGFYTMIFETNYYKLYKTKITPPIRYSVYCKDSKDPKVVEVVNELYKAASGN